MANQLKARIIGVGAYLPSQILTNQDLEKMVPTSDEWIISRTGIKERRIAANDEFPSDMGAKAAERALQSCGLKSKEIDMILVATMTPDYISPSTANLIQAKIGAENAAAMDIQAACTGFLYGLSLAQAYVESGLYGRVLVIATEKMSAFIDYQDRTTCVLFGDGAGAVVVAAQGEGWQVDAVCLGSDGQLANLIAIPAGGSRQPASLRTVEERLHYFTMSGNAVFKEAVRRMSAAARECLGRVGLHEEEMSWIVPHQANKRIIEAMSKSFDIPEGRVYHTLHKYGNTSASSIPIALHELLGECSFQDGEHLLLVAFGGGVTWGASILTKQRQ